MDNVFIKLQDRIGAGDKSIKKLLKPHPSTPQKRGGCHVIQLCVLYRRRKEFVRASAIERVEGGVIYTSMLIRNNMKRTSPYL